MDIVNDVDRFAIQKGIVKDGIVEHISKNTKEQFYREKRLIIVINDNSYLCAWDDDRTIIMNKCKVKFYYNEKLIKTIYLESNISNTIFSFLMDYYEVENIVAYHNQYNKLQLFTF